MDEEEIVIRVQRRDPSASIPKKAHPDDACFDLFSAEECRIDPGSRRAVRTGISLEIPQGWGGFVEPRSGLALRHGVVVLGGVIDSGYRGEILVLLLNLGEDPLVIQRGDRIAQIAFRKIPSVRFEISEELSLTSRGEGGFGSTDGVKNSTHPPEHAGETGPPKSGGVAD